MMLVSFPPVSPVPAGDSVASLLFKPCFSCLPPFEPGRFALS